jgi:hypothetical protein
MDETLLFFVTSWVFSLSSVGLFAAWLGARARAKRAERQLDQVLRRFDDTRPASDERLSSAVDALGLEMERLAEGQRFVARVLAERPAAPAVPPHASPGRVITPH